MSAELEEDALRAICDAAVVRVEVSSQARVVVEPPAISRRDQEGIRPLRPDRFQIIDRGRAVDGMGAEVRALVVLREVPGPPAGEVEQVGVPLVHDGYRRVERHEHWDQLADLSN